MAYNDNDRLDAILSKHPNHIAAMARDRLQYGYRPFDPRELTWLDDAYRDRNYVPLLSSNEAWTLITGLASDLRSAKETIERDRNTKAAQVLSPKESNK